MIELHRGQRQLPMKLANSCKVVSVQLSRRPEDLLVLLTSLRNGELAASTGESPHGKANRRFVEAVIRH
jgi:hypothetical protein